MSNLFERKKIDGSSIRNIKELITNQFKLSENTTLAVAELRCHDPGCPPEETVITARYEDGSIKNWKIGKPINEIKQKDIENLKDQLERATKIVKETGGGILVITEGVFGMSGNMGALSSIVELKKDYNFRLFVDDAHGFGTMGKTGAGCGEEQGVQDEIDLFFSTFAKSMASIGAFVSGMDAGKIYNSWPLMGNSYFPDDNNLKNLFEVTALSDPSLVQFIHRNLACLLYTSPSPRDS